MPSPTDPQPPEDNWQEWIDDPGYPPFQYRKHNRLKIWEKRCRWCKDQLPAGVFTDCRREECRALNVLRK